MGMELTERGSGGRGIYTGILSPLLVLHCRTLGILHERWVYTYLGSVMASMREGVERGMDPGGGGGMSRLPVGFSAVAVVFFSRNSQQVWGTFAPTRLCNDVTRKSRSLSLCLCGYRSLRDAAGTLHTLPNVVENFADSASMP